VFAIPPKKKNREKCTYEVYVMLNITKKQYIYSTIHIVLNRKERTDEKPHRDQWTGCSDSAQ